MVSTLQNLSTRRPTGKDLVNMVRTEDWETYHNIFPSLVGSFTLTPCSCWNPGLMPGAPTEANKFISPSVSFRLEDAKPQQDTGALQLSSTERDKRRLRSMVTLQDLNHQFSNTEPTWKNCPTSFHHLSIAYDFWFQHTGDEIRSSKPPTCFPCLQTSQGRCFLHDIPVQLPWPLKDICVHWPL